MATTRYQRQERFALLGEVGQRKLSESQVLICGCGALGSMIAERLARAGVGHLRIVDRDWVELSNLQRQTLFSERDAEENAPKAIAAANRLQQINSEIVVEPIVEDVTSENIARLADSCQLIADGTDNFETRYLINDYCIANQKPWVHGGCLGSSGQVMSVIPTQTPCFECLLPEVPPPEAIENCDTAGVLGPAIGIVASFQAMETIKILSGNLSSIRDGLMVIDAWKSETRFVKLNRNSECSACHFKQLKHLDGTHSQQSTVLCGKNAVQIQNPQWQDISLELLADKFAKLGPVTKNGFFTRLEVEQFRISVFKGGRTVIEGTTSIAEARSVLSRTVGS